MIPRPAALIAARCVHTTIYVVMAASILAILMIGISGRFVHGLWIVLPLVFTEIVVFTISGLKCPLTAVVNQLSGTGSHVPDTYLPERLTRHTLSIFVPILAVALTLLAARWMGLIVEGMPS